MITAISDLATRKIAGKQYLAPKQLAELLGVRLSSIYEWDAAPKVKFAPDSMVEGDGFELVWGFSCQAVVLGCADSFLFGAGKTVLHSLIAPQMSRKLFTPA